MSINYSEVIYFHIACSFSLNIIRCHIFLYEDRLEFSVIKKKFIIYIDDITDNRISTYQQIMQRMTATRIALFGIFASAMPQKSLYQQSYPQMPLPQPVLPAFFAPLYTLRSLSCNVLEYSLPDISAISFNNLINSLFLFMDTNSGR